MMRFLRSSALSPGLKHGPRMSLRVGTAGIGADVAPVGTVGTVAPVGTVVVEAADTNDSAGHRPTVGSPRAQRDTVSASQSLAALVLLGTAVWLAAPLAAAPPERKFASADESRAEFDRAVAPLLERFCARCHGPDLSEGELNLRSLSPDMKGSTSAARWAVVLKAVSTGKMPPPDAVAPDAPRPDEAAVDTISRWILAELKRAGKHVASRIEAENGNVLAHRVLFGGPSRARPDVGPRLRPLRPEIYESFAKDVGKGANVGQPFSPNPATTFKDMGAARLDEPTTSQLIDNALAMVDQLTPHKLENGVARPERNAPQTLVRLFDERNPATDKELEAAVKQMFEHALRRAPDAAELAAFTGLLRRNIHDAGRKSGVRFALAAVLLLPESILRSERGQGPPDADGRVRLAPREIAFALAYALTDRRPDTALLAAASAGQFDTSAGVEAAARKLLDDPKLAKPRIARFFREYFGYARAVEVFKGEEATEHFPRELVADTDQLIHWILERDRDVFRELLSTNRAFVNYRWDANKRIGLRASQNAVHLAYGLPPDWKWTDKQPIELPANQRAGILTQPAWLVAFSKNDDNDAIHRGIWIRERVLGGVIPNLPITVDAQLPIAPGKTLRERMQVTHEEYCWTCHKLINHVAYPFEIYDHFGRFRVREVVHDLEATARNVDSKGKPLGTVFKPVPIDASGRFDSVEGDALSGETTDAVELVQQLARSPFAEQVFIRHVFRYWMGRNETAGDAASLQAVHHAYRDSGGSMKALLAALLASDSFLYRANEP